MTEVWQRFIRRLLRWRTPPAWGDKKIVFTSKETLQLVTSDSRMNITVHFVPKCEFDADAVIIASSVTRQVADKDNQSVQQSERDSIVSRVKDFLEHNGCVVKIEK